jgi:hypothetical protein
MSILQDVYTTYFMDIGFEKAEYWDEQIIYVWFFHFHMSSMSILKVLIDAAPHSAQVILIWSEIGAKLVELSELECLIWWIAIGEHTLKIE